MKPIACPWNPCGGTPFTLQAWSPVRRAHQGRTAHERARSAVFRSPWGDVRLGSRRGPHPLSQLSSQPSAGHPSREKSTAGCYGNGDAAGGCPASLRGSQWRPGGVGPRRPGLCLYLTAQDGERPLPRIPAAHTRRWGRGSASSAFTLSGHPCSFILYVLLPFQCEHTSLSCFSFVFFLNKE